MAALMKATIDRDDSKPVTSTYQQKTISLAKAKAMRQRPPALMGVDEEAAKRDVERNGAEDHIAVQKEETEAKSGVAAESNAVDSTSKEVPTGLNIEGLNSRKTALSQTQVSRQTSGMTLLTGQACDWSAT